MTATSSSSHVDPSAPPIEEQQLDPGLDADGNSTYGWGMFVSFIAAALAITLAVCVLALVGSWWMLAIAIACHIVITSMMMRVVFHAFMDTPGYEDEEGVEAASRAALAKLKAHTPLIASH